MTIFFTADLHLGHKKILELQKEDRPFSTIEEHDEEIIKGGTLKSLRNVSLEQHGLAPVSFEELELTNE